MPMGWGYAQGGTSMNKRLVCLTLSILMLLTCVFASCTGGKTTTDETESTVDNSAKTITMWVVTEDETTDEAKEAVNEAFAKITKAKFKTNVVIQFCTEDEYYDKLEGAIKAAQDPVSLETPIGEEEDSHLGDFIQDEDTPAPADAASQTILREVIERELHTLTPREEHVIKLRFGLYDGRTRTLEEVGKEFDITRERIRQIEAKALRKLRHPSRARHLKGFLD